MEDKIFSSNFTIKFAEKSLEKAYLNKSTYNILKITKWFSIGLFCLGFIVSILNYLAKDVKTYKQSHNSVNISLNLYLIFIVTGLFFTNSILNFVFCKNYILSKIFCFFDYYAVNYIFMYFSIYLFVISPQEPIVLVYVVFFGEFVIRISFIFLDLINFVESLLLNFLIMFTVWICNYLFGMLDVSFPFIVFHNIQIVFASFYAYFYTRQMRKSFYFYEKEKEKFSWYKSIIENMNSGFIIFKNDKIQFMNKSLMDLFLYKASCFNYTDEKADDKKNFSSKNNKQELNKNNTINFFDKNKETNLITINNENKDNSNKNENIHNIIQLENEKILNRKKNGLKSTSDDCIPISFNFSISQSNEILNEIFKDMEFTKSIKLIIKEEDSNNQNIVNNFEIMKTLKNKILKINKFIYLGTKSFKKVDLVKMNFNEKVECENDEFYYFFDVSARFQKNIDCETFEIILNDITKTKMEEKKNAEFKYKTIFLSKVAHEFKNPLICIIELIDQINEIGNYDDNINRISEISSQIKGISNYLLFLVKDLDYFSLRQTRLNYRVENKMCNIEQIIEFVKSIAIILLKRANKNEKIKLIVDRDPNLNTQLITDEIKLKQILINLISNSVKFTNYGWIKVEIYNNKKDNKDIDFKISDSGIGMKKEKQNFSLFQKSNSKSNLLGSGLGLFIISDLTDRIGTKMKIHSELGKGSEFFFTIRNNIQSSKLEKNLFNGLTDSKSDLKSKIVGYKKKCSFKTSENFEKKEKIIEIFPYYNDLSLKDNYFTSKRSKSLCLFDNKLQNFSETRKSKNLKDFRYSKKGNFPSNLSICCESLSNEKILYSSHSDISSLSNYFQKSDKIKMKNSNSKHIQLLKKNKIDLHSKVEKNSNIEIKSNDVNIIVCDDEYLTRQSSIRIINNTFKTIFNSKNLVLRIHEANDGLETLKLFYLLIKEGKDIFCIISDESMAFLNGSETSIIIKNIVDKKMFKKIPFYLLTAYPKDNFSLFLNNSIEKVFNKPMTFYEIEIIFKIFQD